MEVCNFSCSKWNTLFLLSHHWLITQNARGRAPFLSPTLARVSPFACHSRVTSHGYLKLRELAHRLRLRWRISYKSLCFVDPSLALMVYFFSLQRGEGYCAIEKEEELSNYLILAQGKLASPPLANFRIDKIDPGWTSYKNMKYKLSKKVIHPRILMYWAVTLRNRIDFVGGKRNRKSMKLNRVFLSWPHACFACKSRVRK